MPTASTDDLVHRIHASLVRLVLAVTGGGSEAIGQLLSVPGGSRSVLEAAVPYSAAALTAWLGAPPEHYCSSRTARAMAMVGFERARRHDPAAANLVGIACTASLTSDRPKRGPHRAHLALQSLDRTVSLSVELEKGRRSRAEEEHLVAGLILNLVAEACGIDERLDLALTDREPLETPRKVAPPDWQELLAGRTLKSRVGDAQPGDAPRLVMPGAFNPLHAGHRQIARFASELLHAPAEFELSILNVDKPPLDYLEIDSRVSQFAPGETLWLTRAARFVEKAALFPGATFLVGADTIVRIGNPQYYGGDRAAMEAAVAAIAAHGCRFLVFGRKLPNDFQTLASLTLPESLRMICQEVPEEAFRVDVSSTEVRAKAEGGTPMQSGRGGRKADE